MEQSISEVVVSAQTSDGEAYSVSIPYSWIEESGLVSPGSEASAYEVSVSTDTDGDGFPNWAEYVCGTSPTDPADKLTASIVLESGQPVITYSPSCIAPGFKAVIKGTPDLASPTWQVVTETRTSPFHFFRVEILPEN